MKHESRNQTLSSSWSRKSQNETVGFENAKKSAEKIRIGSFSNKANKTSTKTKTTIPSTLSLPRQMKVNSQNHQRGLSQTLENPKIESLEQSKEFKDASLIVHQKLVEMLKESQKLEESFDSPSEESFYSPAKRNHQKFAAQKIVVFQKRLLFDDGVESAWNQNKEKVDRRFRIAEELEPPQHCKEKEAKQAKHSAKRGVTSGLQDHSSKTRQVFFLDQSCLNSLLSTNDVEDFVETKLSSFLEDGLQWGVAATEEASREVFKQAIRWFDWPRYVQGDSVIWGHSPDPNQEDPGFNRGSPASNWHLSTKQLIDSIDPESNIPVGIGEKTRKPVGSSTFLLSGKGKEEKTQVIDEKSRVIRISDVLLKGKGKSLENQKKPNTKAVADSRRRYRQVERSVFPLETEEDERNFARYVRSDSFWVKDLHQKRNMYEKAKETKGTGFLSFFLNRKSKEEAPLFKLGVFRYLRIQRATSEGFGPTSVPSDYVADSSIPIVVTLAGMFPLGSFCQNAFGLATLTDARTGLNATVTMEEHRDELVVRSSTVYGAVVKFALACLYANNLLSRVDLISKYFEKEFLYSLLKKEKTQEETFLDIIRTCILPYQCTGLLLSEALNQEKELLKSEQVLDSLSPIFLQKTRANLQTFLSRPILKTDQLKDFNPFLFAVDRDLYLPNPTINFA